MTDYRETTHAMTIAAQAYSDGYRDGQEAMRTSIIGWLEDNFTEWRLYPGTVIVDNLIRVIEGRP